MMDFKEEAEKFLKTQDYDGLLKLSEQEILNNPDNIEGYRFKSYCLEDYDEKKKCIDKILELNPKDFETHEEKAICIFNKNKNTNEAIAYLDSIIEEYPDYAEIYIVKANVLKFINIFLSDTNKMRNIDNIMDACFKALELSKSSIEPYNILGDICSERDYEKAKEYFEKALQIDENNYSANIGMARCISKMEGLEEALAFCNDLIEKGPDNIAFYEIKFNFIALYIDPLVSDNIKEMLQITILELFNKLVELNPDESNYYEHLASFYSHVMENADAAIKVYNEAIDKFPNKKEFLETEIKFTKIKKEIRKSDKFSDTINKLKICLCIIGLLILILFSNDATRPIIEKIFKFFNF